MMSNSAELGDLQELATTLADEHQADILLFRGDVTRSASDRLIAERRGRPAKPNVLLILSTLGGSADTAYRVARALRRGYERVTVYVDDYCKTAGTLLALGADELVMSDFGELGPLDSGLDTAVELGAMSSELTSMQTLGTLQVEALQFFQTCFVQLRARSGLPARLAAERATDLATGLFGPIYAQIDPAQLGEVNRGMNTSRQYGARIGTVNLKDGALETLVSSYPSHDFVIDRDEAKTLFHRVREPTVEEAELLTQVEPLLGLPDNQSRFLYLDDLLLAARETDPDEEADDRASEPAAPAGERPTDHADEAETSS